MKKIVCKHCGETVPLGESWTVLGEEICLSCAEIVEETNSSLSAEDVSPNVDRTVCVKCGADRGNFENDLIMGFPVCPVCTPTFGNMPFPAWIKWSAVGLAVLVVLSFVLNMRFYEANKELEAYWEALYEEDYHEATRLAEVAVDLVPEDWELPVLVDYSTGMAFLMDDQPGDALEHFQNCRGILPTEFYIETLIRTCQQGVAFDEGDYAEFLVIAREDLKSNPADPRSMLVVASGLACRFVETGDDDFRNKAEAMINKALELDSGEASTKYAMRIRHRLHSMEILQPREYAARYPYGWTPEGEVQ